MRYRVVVKHNAKYFIVEGETIRIGLTNRPINGKANRELVRKLAKHFQVSTSNIKILSGLKSRNKTIEIVK